MQLAEVVDLGAFCIGAVAKERLAGLGRAHNTDPAFEELCLHWFGVPLVFGHARGIQITFLLGTGDFDGLVRNRSFVSKARVEKPTWSDEGEHQRSGIGIGVDHIGGD